MRYNLLHHFGPCIDHGLVLYRDSNNILVYQFWCQLFVFSAFPVWYWIDGISEIVRIELLVRRHVKWQLTRFVFSHTYYRWWFWRCWWSLTHASLNMYKYATVFVVGAIGNIDELPTVVFMHNNGWRRKKMIGSIELYDWSAFRLCSLIYKTQRYKHILLTSVIHYRNIHYTHKIKSRVPGTRMLFP